MGVQSRLNVTRKRYFLEDYHVTRKETLDQDAGASADLEYFTVVVKDPADGFIKPMTLLTSTAGLSDPYGLVGVKITAAEWAAGNVADVPVIRKAKLVNQDLVVLLNSLTLDDIITGVCANQSKTIKQALEDIGIMMAECTDPTAYENA